MLTSTILSQHLLYLRKTDRGSKAVVFSAFPDALVRSSLLLKCTQVGLLTP